MRIGVFTIASKNYLAYVRVLMDSMARVHPEFERHLCLADRVDGAFEASAERFRVIEAEALGIPEFSGMALRYDIMELNTAVKPFMFRWLFEHTDLDAVIYMDPDTCAYERFDRLEQLLAGGASVVLTPHVTRPLEDGRTPNDYHMLQTGVFNLGFIAAARKPETLDFMDWWGRKLVRGCVVDLPAGLFVDQKWCDMAPCLLAELAVMRDETYNVAYWNLAHRRVARDAGQRWRVNGEPLRFFHFSGVSSDKRRSISKHQDRIAWDDVPQTQPLFEEYFARLDAAGWPRTRGWKYAYDTLEGGLKLVRILRLMIQDLGGGGVPVPRPLNSDALVAYCNEPAPEVTQDATCRVTRLMHRVYRLRPDVQAAFRLDTSEGRSQFADWFRAAGVREYQLPDSLARVDLLPGAASPPAALADGTPARWLAEFGRRRVTIAEIDDPAAINLMSGVRPVTNLMFMIWLARRDLQEAFDLRSTAGQEAYLDWCEVSLPREYGIEPRPEPGGGSALQPPPDGGGAWSRLLARLTGGLREPRAGSPAAQGVPRVPAGRAPVQRASLRPGASLVGYARAEIGMGEHVRMSAAALGTTDVDFGVVDYRGHAAANGEVRPPPGAFKASVFHVNADQMLPAFCHLGREFFSGRYNIGYWAWELARCPDEWLPAFGLVDEIWAPSRFIQQAFAERTGIPVEYMPICVSLPRVDNPGRAALGVPEDKFLFLFTFDFLSYIERKNPFAAIRAFKAAFPAGGEKVGLVIKAMNVDESGARWREMQALIDGDPRVTVLSGTMRRELLYGLVQSCDCYVSLHRSEGFGRGPAEAMALGKPVIVTGYSGNLDFTRPDNACLVDFELVPVPEGQYVFGRGQVWAEADVDHAAWHMRTVFCDQGFRAEIGARARHCIQSEFGPAVIGARYRARLKSLGLA